jgi:F-type H+-transporting ATPase subunit alpha
MYLLKNNIIVKNFYSFFNLNYINLKNKNLLLSFFCTKSSILKNSKEKKIKKKEIKNIKLETNQMESKEKKTFENTIKKVKSNLIFRPLSFYQNSGIVLSVSDGVAKIYGLFNVSQSELVIFENGLKGMALNLNATTTGIVIFGNDHLVRENFVVQRLNCIVNVNTGFSMLNRVINSLGEFIDKKVTTIKNPTPYKSNINYKAPGIIVRESVREPLQTGLKAIDSMVPIGRGQRELIIGDRQTGKTTVSIDTILNQKYNNILFNKTQNIYCIYIAIGQKRSIIAKIVNYLKKVNSFFYTTVVCSTASESASLQYLAPYSGCSLGE